MILCSPEKLHNLSIRETKMIKYISSHILETLNPFNNNHSPPITYMVWNARITTHTQDLWIVVVAVVTEWFCGKLSVSVHDSDKNSEDWQS